MFALFHSRAQMKCKACGLLLSIARIYKLLASPILDFLCY